MRCSRGDAARHPAFGTRDLKRACGEGLCGVWRAGVSGHIWCLAPAAPPLPHASPRHLGFWGASRWGACGASSPVVPFLPRPRAAYDDRGPDPRTPTATRKPSPEGCELAVAARASPRVWRCVGVRWPRGPAPLGTPARYGGQRARRGRLEEAVTAPKAAEGPGTERRPTSWLRDALARRLGDEKGAGPLCNPWRAAGQMPRAVRKERGPHAPPEALAAALLPPTFAIARAAALPYPQKRSAETTPNHTYRQGVSHHHCHARVCSLSAPRDPQGFRKPVMPEKDREAYLAAPRRPLHNELRQPRRQPPHSTRPKNCRAPAARHAGPEARDHQSAGFLALQETTSRARAGCSR
jgi:hypothetical protein